MADQSPRRHLLRLFLPAREAMKSAGIVVAESPSGLGEAMLRAIKE
jgi:hypothetical protein